MNFAEYLAGIFADLGVRRIFGVPGGGSSLDLIAAARALQIDFVLTRSESAAVMMAAIDGELRGAPGVVLTTKGPGVANAANGLAYAALDRAPLIYICDGFDEQEQSYVTHQVFDQAAMLAPISKGFTNVCGENAAQEIENLVALAMTPPYGPVCIELTGSRARHTAPRLLSRQQAAKCGASADIMQQAAAILSSSRRPVAVVGLEARSSAPALKSFLEALGCPTLTTYKAKGVVAGGLYAGLFTAGAAEAECVRSADLIILLGLDPVEFLRKPWMYQAPVLDVASVRHSPHYVDAALGVYGDLDENLGSLARAAVQSDWSRDEIAQFRNASRQRLAYRSGDTLNPQHVVEIAAEQALIAQTSPRITVDAGAHMFSAMAFWPCQEAFDVLISNGLATMAFALPAAIAAALHDQERPVIAFTGDGGLMMCLGELSTAVESRARVIVVVFNDGSLSLIDIKRGEPPVEDDAVRWSRPDFAAVMTGLGGLGLRADTPESYRSAMGTALRADGPVLIDACIDPSGYAEQMIALRG